MEKYSRKNPSKWQRRYSEEFKRSVVEEYINGNIPVRKLENKHNLGHGRVTVWLKEFGYELKNGYFPSVILKDMPEKPKEVPKKAPYSIKSAKEDSDASLKEQLENALILAEGYKRMIEIAEQNYNIPIRKKSDTK